MALEVTGFYTEELRDSKNYRIGFDIVTLDNVRGVLARKSNAGSESKYKVGSYNVHIEEFEKVALPIFNKTSSILIIDEIGKMELLSKKFEAKIKTVLTGQKGKIIATVPLKGGGPLVQKLKSDTSNHLFTVNVANRDNLVEEIIPLILQ
ncbi:nucleoside-triphosphatase THEP1 isoform X2 [Zophobas morio]